MLTVEKQISKIEILKKIKSRENEETISFNEAYKQGKNFINNLGK